MIFIGMVKEKILQQSVNNEDIVLLLFLDVNDVASTTNAFYLSSV